MRRVVVFTLALAIGFGALVVISASGSVAAGEAGIKLALATDYLLQRIDVAEARGAHRIGLDVKLDEKGGGKGSLHIDPNTESYNQFGDITSVTEIATFRVEVTLTAVKSDDPAKKDRRLYEIQGEKLKGRLFLVVSPKDAGPHRLLIADKSGTVKHVLPLKGEGKGK